MKRIVLPTVSLILALFSSFSALLAATEIDKIEQGTIYFKSTSGESLKPLKTKLYDLQALGSLQSASEKDPPYFLFKGRPCEDCLQDLGIYAFRADGQNPSTFVFPGRIVDGKTRGVVLESRSFYGHCLYKEKQDVYLVFQKERVDRRSGLQSSVYIAQVGGTHLEERLIERHMPRIQDTMTLVKNKSCHEIPGRSRQMLRKPLDLKPRHAPSDDEDDDDANAGDASE